MLLRSYFLRKACVLLTLGVSSVLFGETIQTTGVGSTQADALMGAKKNAVWKAAASILPESELKEKQGKITSTILSRADQFVESHSLLESSQDYGLYSVNAKVEVSLEKLEAELASQGIYATPVSMPKVMVVLKESSSGAGSGASTNFALESALTNKGYRIIEKEQLEQLQKSNDNTLASMAFQSGADLIVKGNITVGAANSKTIYGVTQTTVPVTMNIRIVRADNAEIIHSFSKSISDKNMNEESARSSAIQKGNSIVAKQVHSAITEYWNKQSTGIRNLELIAQGSAAQLQALPGNLGAAKSIMNISLRFMEDGVGFYDCKVRGSQQDIRAALEASGSWSVVGLGQGRMKIKSGAASTPVEIGMEAPEFSISSFEIADIFPSLVKYYAKNDIAKVSVAVAPGSNISKGKVSIIIPSLMDLAAEKQISLASGQEKSVSLPLIFNENKLLAVKSQKSVPAQVKISFYQNGKQHERNLVVPVKVHQVNGMDWNDMASLGSFITHENSTVEDLARKAMENLTHGTMNDQFEQAVAIFALLRSYGMTYVKDPANSSGNGLDKVQFPVETLRKKSGDCDDTSILFASLLSSINIPVSFIVYADHVLIMFDTGIFEKNIDKLGVDKSHVVVHEGRCWIPIETTQLKKSFFEAWSIAAEEFRQAIADKEHIDIMSVEEAWKKYQPFEYSKTHPVTIGNAKGAIDAELVTVQKKTIEMLTQQINAIKGNEDDIADHIRLGALYARAGKYKEALDKYAFVAGRMPNDHIVLNNYACALILSGDEDAALTQINKSLAIKKSTEAMVNKALCYYLKATDQAGIDKFVEILIDVQDNLPKDKSLDKLLGLELGSKATERASGDHDAAKPKTIDKSRLQDLIRKRVVARQITNSSTASSHSGNVMPFGGVRGADPTQVAKVADLICWLEI